MYFSKIKSNGHFFFISIVLFFPNTLFCFFCTVGLSDSQRIDCCTTMSNNNYQHPFSISKLQLLNSLHSASSVADSPTTNRNNLVSTSSNLSRRPSFTLQSPLQHRPIVENIILSDNNNTYRQNNHFPDPFNFNQSSRSRANAFSSLRRSDSYSPGTVWS